MPTSQKSLISMLKCRKNFKIPTETHTLHEKSWSFATDKYCLQNTLNNPQYNDQIVDIMSSTFYCEAPVPTVLQLGRTDCNKTKSIVKKEINNAIISGGSLVYTAPRDEKIISIALNMVWTRNDDYEVIGSNAKNWHNAAANIVGDAINPYALWRDYQFQHIYDVGQSLLKQAPEKKYALYLSTGYINPLFRRSGASSASEVSRLDDYHTHWNLSECLIYFATTFSKMEPHIKKYYPNYVPFDYVSYAEEKLTVEGRRCFREVEKLGGIRYYVDFLRTFVPMQ